MAAKLSREAIAKRRYRQGLRTFRVAADRADLVELLTEAGVVVGINADTSDISDALTRLVEQWNAGKK